MYTTARVLPMFSALSPCSSPALGASCTSLTTSRNRESDRRHPVKARRPNRLGCATGQSARRGGPCDRRGGAGCCASALGRSVPAGRGRAISRSRRSTPARSSTSSSSTSSRWRSGSTRAVAGAVAVECRDQPLAAGLYDSAGPVHRARRNAATKSSLLAAGRGRSSRDPRRIQPLPPRSDDCRRRPHRP